MGSVKYILNCTKKSTRPASPLRAEETLYINRVLESPQGLCPHLGAETACGSNNSPGTNMEYAIWMDKAARAARNLAGKH